MRIFRTLICIDNVIADANQFSIIVPGWDHTEKIWLNIDSAPFDIQHRVLSGQTYFHASVDLGANFTHDLKVSLKDWENE